MHRSFQDRKDSQVSMIWGSRNIFLYKSKAQYALCSLVPLYVSLVFSRFFCCCLFVLGFVLLCFFFLSDTEQESWRTSENEFQNYKLFFSPSVTAASSTNFSMISHSTWCCYCIRANGRVRVCFVEIMLPKLKDQSTQQWKGIE